MYEFVLSQWFSANPDTIDFFSVDELKRPYTSDEFMAYAAKRNALYSQTKSQLSKAQADLDKKKKRIIDKITKIAEQPVYRVSNLVFEDQNNNLQLHILGFAQRYLHDLKLKIFNKELEHTITRYTIVTKFIDFFENAVLGTPADVIFSLQKNLFIYENKELDSMIYHKKAMKAFIQRKIVEVEGFRPPQWIYDFNGFFDGLISSALTQTTRALSYVQPLPGEVDLSRSIFCGDNHHTADEIDALVETVTSCDMARFARSVATLSLRLIPRASSRPGVEKSIGILFFFRVIFDRLYIKNHNLVYKQEMDDRSQKVPEISRRPIKLFKVPNGMLLSNGGASIREVFQNEYFFHSASLFLNEMIYVTNPIDALYFMYRSLLMIQKAALMKELSGKGEACIEDLNKLLPFDHLFALLVGVLLASDIPDFFAVADFVKRFTPSRCLSDDFDYAYAAVNSLSVHLEEMMEKDRS